MPTRPGAPLRLGLAAAALLLLTAPTALAADRDVDIRDFAFAPRTVEIRVGDTVTWTNRDAVGHTATARNGSWDTGALDEGQSGSVRFTVAGTYRYVCTPHPDMTGTVVVRAATGGVRPPNTDTEAEVRGDHRPGLVALAAMLGGIAFLVARRRFDRIAPGTPGAAAASDGTSGPATR